VAVVETIGGIPKLDLQALEGSKERQIRAGQGNLQRISFTKHAWPI
jgi:hypothetical protein